jgi:phospholipase C
VNRALDVLAKTNDPVAHKAIQRMRTRSCQTNWEEGLWDADDGTLAETGGAKGTHFYNGAGRDFWGNATSVVTYIMGTTEQNAQGNARDQAKKHVANVASAQTDAGCHELGLALHYMTDMTQPMHSSGHSGATVPLSQHPAFEDSVGMIQARFPASTVWDGRWKDKTSDEVFYEASVRANSFAPALAGALKYDGTICTITSEPISEGFPVTYTGNCFLNQPTMISKTGEILLDAYQSTASFLYSIFRTAS